MGDNGEGEGGSRRPSVGDNSMSSSGNQETKGKPRKVKKMCGECGHRHKWGVYCHYYAEAPVDDPADAAGGEGGEDDDEEEPEEEEDLLGEKVQTGPVFEKKEEATMELHTPPFVKAIGYKRCNCLVGVPAHRDWEQLPQIVQVGPLVVPQYDQIMDNLKPKPPKLLSKDEEELVELLQKRAYQNNQMIIVPLVMQFLREGHCSPIPKVSSVWNLAAQECEAYIDVRNMAPWQAYRPHYGEVTSLKLIKPQGRVYSGGDRRILASDINEGRVLALITRDSGDITGVGERGNELFVASATGAVRTYMLNFNPAAIKLNKTMWDHSKGITDMLASLPTVGPCPQHGVAGHTCFLYTTSEDRSIRVWNIDTYRPYRAIIPPSLRRTSFTCISQSGRHLFAGTSAACVMVFTKFEECERDDVHACSTPGASKMHCLQITLKLPPLLMSSGHPPAVTSVKCAGWNYSFTHLWAADSTGQITVWFVPEEGLEFLPAKTWKAHTGAINAMAATWKHMITVSDDGFLLLYELDSLHLIRRLNVLEWCSAKGLLSRPDIPRRLKCIDVVEDQEEGGMLVVGTQYGDIVVMSIGRLV